VDFWGFFGNFRILKDSFRLSCSSKILRFFKVLWNFERNLLDSFIFFGIFGDSLGSFRIRKDSLGFLDSFIGV